MTYPRKKLSAPDEWTAELTIDEVGENLTDDSTTPLTVSGPAEIRGFELYNSGQDKVYLQVFNAALADVTVGTTVPDEYYEIGAQGVYNRPAGKPIKIMGTRMSFAATSTATGNGAPSADLTGKICYGTIQR